jgi:hypothetical protein
VTAVLVVVVVVSTGIRSPNQRTISPITNEQGATAWVEVHAGTHALGVEMTVSFPNNRRMLSGYVEVDGKQHPVSFYPNDGTDNDVQPNPLPLAAGVSVTSSATLSPDCSTSAKPPVLVLRSHLDNGNISEDRFRSSNPREFAADVKDWCAIGGQATVSRADGPGDGVGDVRAKLLIVNLVTKPATVTSGAYDVGPSHWTAATVTIPPGANGTLVITATDSSCSAQENPWNAGHLKSNGQPLKVTNGTEWC